MTLLAQKLTDMQGDLKGKSVLQDRPAHLTPDTLFFFGEIGSKFFFKTKLDLQTERGEERVW